MCRLLSANMHTYRRPNEIALAPIVRAIPSTIIITTIVAILMAILMVLATTSVISIGRIPTLDIPTQVSPSLLVSGIVGIGGFRKEIGSVCSIGSTSVGSERVLYRNGYGEQRCEHHCYFHRGVVLQVTATKRFDSSNDPSR